MQPKVEVPTEKQDDLQEIINKFKLDIDREIIERNLDDAPTIDRQPSKSDIPKQ